jgi:hypothetical protein
MTNTTRIMIADICGLTLSGWEDNAPQFIGDDKEWELYTETIKHLEEQE